MAEKVISDSSFLEPNSSEIYQLQHTDELFRSNLFKLQINELLNEVNLDEHLKVEIENLLNLFNENIDNSSKHVIGSFLLNTMVKPIVNIDVAVMIPKAKLYTKDHLNRRYLTKRTEYMQYVKEKLQVVFPNISIGYFREDNDKPILIVEHVIQNGQRKRKKGQINVIQLRVYIIVDRKHIQVNKLLPNRNADRSCQYDNGDHMPTPFYNMQILEDVQMLHHVESLHSFLQDCSIMIEAIQLLKVWNYQRFGYKSKYNFNGFLLSMLVLYLSKTHQINKKQSVYQIFRSVLVFLSKHDLTREAISLYDKMKNKDEDRIIDHKLWYNHFEVVFIDESGKLNLAGRITASSYNHLQYEARRSLNILDPSFGFDLSNDSKTGVVRQQYTDIRYQSETQIFQALFTTPLDMALKYDLHFQIHLTPQTKQTLMKKKMSLLKLCIPTISVYQLAVMCIYDILKQALGNRCNLIVILDNELVTSNDMINIGICLNQTSAYQIIDLGPSADDHEKAKQFRNFWGIKSEIRRFKDGSILEAVVWDEYEKNEIIDEIVKYVLNRFFQISKNHVQCIGNIFNRALLTKKDTMISKNAINAFNILKDLFKNLPNFPLSVTSIQAVHSMFSGCNASTYQLLNIKSSNEYIGDVINVVVQFEASSKWPDDIIAIQQIKKAFYIRLASILMRRKNMVVQVTHKYLDIAINDFVFRIRIFHNTELLLVKGNIQQQRLNKYEEQRQFAECSREEVILPQHISHLRAVHTKYIGFSQACQLAKRWISSHYFSNQLSDEVIELLIAYICVCSNGQQFCISTILKPYSMCTSPYSIFSRFLRLLSKHDWLEEPIIVDLNETMTHDQFTEILTSFQEQRQQKTGAIMFIGTVYDLNSMAWTHDKPTYKQLNTISKYARSSWKVLQEIAMKPGNYSYNQWLTIFKTPMNNFNLFIKCKYDELSFGKGWWAGFNVFEVYLKELNQNFGNIAMFDYNPYGHTNLIVGKWIIDVTATHNFSVASSKYSQPSDRSDQISMNLKEIVALMKNIGQGLVENIYFTYEQFCDSV